VVRVAITGASGQLGRRLVETFRSRGSDVLELSRPEFRLESADSLEPLARWNPEVVIHAAAWTDVDGCAREPDLAAELNGRAAGRVAQEAARLGALMVQISTNEVFDGARKEAYRESDAPNPINPYGASKLLGEELVQAASGPDCLIIRTAWLFGPGGRNFVTKILAAADDASKTGRELRVVNDEWGNPTPTVWLAGAIHEVVAAALSDPKMTGIWHLAGTPATTRAGWASAILRGMAVEIVEVPGSAFQRASAVPPRAVLETARTALAVPGDWIAATDELVAAVISRSAAR
jgi:dTDP-4-dehydrorhamnose reductase